MLRDRYSKKIFTFSNILTASRLVLTPFIVSSLINHMWGVAFFLFLLAGVSDLLDGFIARLLNEPTSLGAILDPIADKVLLVSSLIAFLLSCTNILLPTWFVIFISCREACLLLGGAFLFFNKKAFQVQPNFLGKATTFLMIVLMLVVLLGASFNVRLFEFESILICSILVTAIISFVQYFLRMISLVFISE